ncbi:MAG TPA: hypothetical protein VH796_00260 [Nitrososphaeraceae archaeon]
MKRQTATVTVIAAVIGITMLISTQHVYAFKETRTSYNDGYNRGFTDARCDRNFCHGHGYDPSCPRGHTDLFCSGYSAGYRNGWNSR